MDPVPSPSSNRTGGFPASGFRLIRHLRWLSQGFEAQFLEVCINAHVWGFAPPSLTSSAEVAGHAPQNMIVDLAKGITRISVVRS